MADELYRLVDTLNERSVYDDLPDNRPPEPADPPTRKETAGPDA